MLRFDNRPLHHLLLSDSKIKLFDYVNIKYRCHCFYIFNKSYNGCLKALNSRKLSTYYFSL